MTDMMKPLTDDPRDYTFFDAETRALPSKNLAYEDVTMCGAERYSLNAKVTVFTYAIGEGKTNAWVLRDFDDVLKWRDAPPDLQEQMSRMLKGEAWFVAGNSAFDRRVANRGIFRDRDIPYMPIRGVLDAFAQFTASNLPGKLEGASRAIGRKGKVDGGKALIQMFAPSNGCTPQSHPEEFEQFIGYGIQDTVELQQVFLSTRPLWRWEWEEFWASEVINDRGLPIDREFAVRAAALADTYVGQVNDLVKKFTRGHCWSVNQHVALANWVYDEIAYHPEASDILVKKYDEDVEGDGLVPAALSLARERVEKLIPFLERIDAEQGLTDDEFDLLQLLEVRQFGASATPKKFAKLLPMLNEADRLCGQYTFNGAQQTGRYSSRGVQVHNLTRAFVGMEDGNPDREVDAIEYINDLEIDDAR